MNRYFIIDRINKEIIDTNNLKGDFDQFGSSVSCVDTLDLYKEAVIQIIDEIRHAGDIEDRKELIKELIEKLEEQLKELKQTHYEETFKDGLPF